MKSVLGRLALALSMLTPLAAVGLVTTASAVAQVDVAGRLADSRANGPTVDGQYSGFGATKTNGRIYLQVAGRAGVPANARSAALTVTAVRGRNSGYVTIDDCAASVPNTSNLNFQTGQTIANLAITELNSDGMACIYTSGVSDLVVDVAAPFRRMTSRRWLRVACSTLAATVGPSMVVCKVSAPSAVAVRCGSTSPDAPRSPPGSIKSW